MDASENSTPSAASINGKAENDFNPASVDQYRIGVVGPSGCGKSLLLSQLTRCVTVECKRCLDCKSSLPSDQNNKSSTDSTVSPTDSDTSLSENAEVISVVVKEQGPLGLKIAKHKIYTGFVYVKGFARTSGAMHEIERSGKIKIGDLLVAVNRQNLLHLCQENIADILRRDDHDGMRVLTFLRAPSAAAGSAPQCDDVLDMSCRSAVSGHCAAPAAAVCDRWRTNAVIDDRVCCIEFIDIPGNDPGSGALKSHINLLDGLLFVYSVESASSLLALEKKYARVIPGLDQKNRQISDISEMPLVVVGTSHANYNCENSPQSAAQMRLLLSEGNCLADAWGAPPVQFASIGEHNAKISLENTELEVKTDVSEPSGQIIDILTAIIRRVDDLDDPSLFSADIDSRLNPLACLWPMCFNDVSVDDSIRSSTNDSLKLSAGVNSDISSKGLDSTIGNSIRIVEGGPTIKRKNRKLPRKMTIAELDNMCKDDSSPRSVTAVGKVQDPNHPSEETNTGILGFARASSSKFVNFIYYSCSE